MRQAARALLVDPAGRVLLVAYAADDGGTVWGTVGGGIEPGESPAGALAREVREETGHRLGEVGPELWRRVVAFTWRLAPFEQAETVWLVRTPAFEPVTGAWTQVERESVRGLRWWTPAELAASGERFSPADLPARVTRLGRGPSNPAGSAAAG